MWQDVRNRAGKLLFRFDAERDIIEIGERRRVEVVDLKPLRAPNKTREANAENPLADRP